MNERRTAKRFQVDWQVRIEAQSEGGGLFVESGILRNISSGGALLTLRTPVPNGSTLVVYIRLPLRSKKWMKYPARVIRIDEDGSPIAAVRFDSVKPVFKLPLSLVS